MKADEARKLTNTAINDMAINDMAINDKKILRLILYNIYKEIRERAVHGESSYTNRFLLLHFQTKQKVLNQLRNDGYKVSYNSNSNYLLSYWKISW